jgi:hypothetical protein
MDKNSTSGGPNLPQGVELGSAAPKGKPSVQGEGSFDRVTAA